MKELRKRERFAMEKPFEFAEIATEKTSGLLKEINKGNPMMGGGYPGMFNRPNPINSMFPVSSNEIPTGESILD